jgi:phosphomannomutase
VCLWLCGSWQSFPNPEEKGALSLACSHADAVGATLVLANDPDADRLAVAERQGEGGGWHVFNGNELGTLLGCWEWEEFRRLHPDVPPSRASMVASTVSSKMLRAVGEAEGFGFEETLTGFKWIGNKAVDLRRAGQTVLFSYEEAIGFCLGDVVPDKDGVAAAAVMAEMALQLRQRGQTLKQRLEALHARYGEFVSNNHYYFCYEPQTVAAIFRRLRNAGQYWDACAGYRIAAVRDLTSPGYDSTRPDKRPTLPVSSGTEMITYSFENGCVLTLRTSGTEPKLKYYSEMRGRPGVDKAEVAAQLRDMMAAVLPEMLEPDKNGLK